MSPAGVTRQTVYKRFPRVSGDEPEHNGKLITYELFSPRERG